MFDDVGAMFLENVLKCYTAYVKQRDSDTSRLHQHLREALEVSAALFHLREHLPNGNRMSRESVEAACPEYRLIADVVNAAKHKNLNRSTPNGAPLIKSVSDVSEVTIITSYEDAEGDYSDAQTLIVVESTAGELFLDVAITQVINFWGRTLSALGFIPSFSDRAVPEIRSQRLIARSEVTKPNLQMIQGMRFTKAFQLRKWNYKTNKSDPVDLTDCKIEGSIYIPTYAVDITLTPRASGEPITCSLNLTGEQHSEFLNLVTDEERQAFVMRLMTERGSEIQEAIEAAIGSSGAGGGSRG